MKIKLLSFTLGAILMFALIQLSRAGDLADYLGHAVHDGTGDCVHCVNGTKMPECEPTAITNDQNWIIRDDTLPIRSIEPVWVIAASSIDNIPPPELIHKKEGITQVLYTRHQKPAQKTTVHFCPTSASITSPQPIVPPRTCPPITAVDSEDSSLSAVIMIIGVVAILCLVILPVLLIMIPTFRVGGHK